MRANYLGTLFVVLLMAGLRGWWNSWVEAQPLEGEKKGVQQKPARTPIERPTAPVPASPSPGRIQGRDGVEMVRIPAGEFLMGSPTGEEYPGANDEHPQHRVRLDAFYLDKVEVTNARYRKCVEAGKCIPPHNRQAYDDSRRSNHPVVNVEWEEARAYCGWVGRRLPTEAEWEKAARGTDGRAYPWGSEPGPRYANLEGSEDGYGGTAPVGSFPSGASPYGALDMVGNVWEWVADWYGEGYYAHSPSRNPQGPLQGEYRVLRGASWGSDWVSARSARRHWHLPGNWTGYYGFRCVQDLR